MPLGRLKSRARTLLGWLLLTPIEWGLVALIAAAIILGARPHYERWRRAHVVEEEQYVAMRVRGALRPEENGALACPAALDTCPDGAAAGDCPFFDRVLAEPVHDAGWRKVDGVYHGPAGGAYRYDRAGCLFLQIAAPGDSS